MAFLIPFAVAGAAAAVGAAAASGGGDKKPPSLDPAMVAMANASKETAIIQSNNMLMAMQAQAATMELGILENSKNAQFQTQAWLTERLDTLDTKLQVAAIDAKQEMRAEYNRHIEAMTKARNGLHQLQSTYSTASDLPPPSFDETEGLF